MSDTVVKEKTYILGLDISKSGLIISLLNLNRSDPVTISSENEKSLIIPICIAKEQNIGRWFIGQDAKQKALEGAYLCEDLFTRAINKESVEIEGKKYSYEELFLSFFRRVLDENSIDLSSVLKIVVTVAEVINPGVDFFEKLKNRLGLSKNSLTLIDHKESFIYYTLSQNPGVYAANVVLYEYSDNKIYSYVLNRNTETTPYTVNIKVDLIEPSLSGKDKDFCTLINRTIGDLEVSSVFLMGDGFSNDWMAESVELLCKDRRVFLGDNLYSKGACFCGRIKATNRPWNYIYIGDHEMKMDIMLKVLKDNSMTFVNLVKAGENWYETGNEVEVILDGEPKFECWVHSPNVRQAKIHTIELNEMPKRENRTTRLRISAIPKSNSEVIMEIRDLGFGDISPTTNMVWERVIDLEEKEVRWVN